MGDLRNDLLLWAGLALLLIAAETLAPGIFLMWLGFAAAVMFLVVLLVPGIPPLWQAIAFIALSFVSIAVYRRWFRAGDGVSDQPLLNRRGEQLVGQVFPLEQAIVNGQGRLKIGDAFWPVRGPELPAASLVRIVAVESMTLRVEPAA